jgi:hypothetical protein
MKCADLEPATQVIGSACHVRATASGISRRLTEFGLDPVGYRVGERVLTLAGGVQVDQGSMAGGVTQRSISSRRFAPASATNPLPVWRRS